MKKQRLELTWIGKDQQPRLEPRILIEDPTKSYYNPHSTAQHSTAQHSTAQHSTAQHSTAQHSTAQHSNLLIKGDNLLAVKALEQDFAGKIKCIFIDPPYNTGSAFEHYDDGIEHSLWLSLMRDRLVILRNLLSNDGSIWITIDDHEIHYLKVLCDEIFGRNNFIANIVWQKKSSPSNDAKWISDNHDHIRLVATA